MSKFDKFLNKAKDVATIAGKKTGEVVDNSKIKLRAVAVKNDIAKLHERIGGLVCQSYKSGENFQDIIQKLYEDVLTLEEELNELEESLAAGRDSKRCDSCGAFCPESAQFCVKCGEQFGSKEQYKAQAEDVTVTEVTEETEEEIKE